MCSLVKALYNQVIPSEITSYSEGHQLKPDAESALFF